MHRRQLVTSSLALAGSLSLRRMFAAPVTPVATPTSGYARPDWFADPAWLQAQIAAKANLAIFAMTDEASFEKGHVPGAVQIDWPDLQITETSDQSVATWRTAVEQKLTARGISPAQTVVIYDGGTLYSPRVWWILDQLGHADKRMLNGGFPAWSASGAEVQTGPVTPTPSATPYAGTPNEDAIATLAEVETAVQNKSAKFVDARTADEFEAGHIPGAVNVPFLLNGTDQNPALFKSAGELLSLYSNVGVTQDDTVIPYCSTGVRSATTYFTLKLIGFEKVSLFTGSMAEWSQHPELTEEKG